MPSMLEPVEVMHLEPHPDLVNIYITVKSPILGADLEHVIEKTNPKFRWLNSLLARNPEH